MAALDRYCAKPSSAKRLHKTRKQIARLQATLQDVSDVVPGAEALLERVHELHRRAGRIRDADVLLARLDVYERSAARGEFPKLEALREDLLERRRAGRKKLRTAINAIDLEPA